MEKERRREKERERESKEQSKDKKRKKSLNLSNDIVDQSVHLNQIHTGSAGRKQFSFLN